MSNQSVASHPNGGNERPIDAGGKMPRRQRGGAQQHTPLNCPSEKMPRRQHGGGGPRSPEPVLR